MTKQRAGFTILEVVLFLAISTLLLMSVTWGITRRISDGRYNSAVNGFADFLKGAYFSATNVENARYEQEGSREYCTLNGATSNPKGNKLEMGVAQPYPDYPGRTSCAIYGKLIIFGNSDGTRTGTRLNADGNVYTFDLVGDAVEQQMRMPGGPLSSAATILDELKAVHLDFLALAPTDPTVDSSMCRLIPAANSEKYILPWQTHVYSTPNNPYNLSNSDDFVGMMMIVRSPISREVSTFVYQADLDDRTMLKYVANATENNDSAQSFGCADYSGASSIASTYNLSFKEILDRFSNNEDKGFCIASDEPFVNHFRRYIGVSQNGQNASSITVDSSEGNPCY